MGHILWPVTHVTGDPWPSPRPWHESITTPYESWWVHDYCLLFSAIWNYGYGYESSKSCLPSKSYKLNTMVQFLLFVTFLIACQAPIGPALHTIRKLCSTSYTFTPHLIMGHVFYGADPWPTWPIHIWRSIWPMTHDPLTDCQLWLLFCVFHRIRLLCWPNTSQLVEYRPMMSVNNVSHSSLPLLGITILPCSAVSMR